jgi:hypothetical protein
MTNRARFYSKRKCCNTATQGAEPALFWLGVIKLILEDLEWQNFLIFVVILHDEQNNNPFDDKRLSFFHFQRVSTTWDYCASQEGAKLSS